MKLEARGEIQGYENSGNRKTRTGGGSRTVTKEKSKDIRKRGRERFCTDSREIILKRKNISTKAEAQLVAEMGCSEV